MSTAPAFFVFELVAAMCFVETLMLRSKSLLSKEPMRRLCLVLG